jgi:Tol biopolymer transport system component
MKGAGLFGAIVCILILLVSVLYGTAAQDDPLEREIIFSSGHYYYDILLLSDGEVTSLTDGTNQYTRLNTPRWSPSGERIAFTDGRYVYVMDADGSNLVQLTDDVNVWDKYIDWSPDGQAIAAVSTQGDAWRIRLIDVDTLKIVDITQGDYLDGMFGLSWSPDGEFIVFTSNRDGEIPDASGLYLVEVEGGDVSALTDISTLRRDDRYPSWSPDGTQIAFISENADDGGWDIYLIDVDGSNLQRLTNRDNAPEISGLIFFGGTIDWSPDGDRIVFTACPNLYPEGCELFAIGVDGTSLTQITDDDEAGAFYPDWKPMSVEVPETSG